MTEDERIDKALELKSLNLPAKPKIVKLEWEPYEDSLGDEALELFVLFSDSTTDEEIEHAPIHEIEKKIMDRLAAHGVGLFPYFWFLREREHHAARGEA
jgi:hypothetical protein